MADSEGDRQGQQTGLSEHTIPGNDGEGENLVSSSTGVVVTKSERGEENMDTESLPQTYRASPPLPLTPSHHSLPHPPISTVYTTMAQSSFADSEIHRTVAMAGHPPYPDVSVSTTLPLHEQIAYVSGGLPSRSVSSILMTHADMVATEPIDFRRSSVSRGSEAGRMSVGEGAGGEGEVGGVSLVVNPHSMSVAHSSDVGRGSEPHAENLSRVTLPQTADIGRLSSQDIERAIIQAQAVDRMSNSQTRDIHHISEDLTTRSVSENITADIVNEHNISSVSVLDSGEGLRKHADHVERMNLSTSVGRGSPQAGVQTSRMSTSSTVSAISLDADTRQLPVHEAERFWISVPVTGHSVSFSDSSKMTASDSREGMRTTVSLTGDLSAVSALSASEASGIPATDLAGMRAVVMSHMDDFRISLPSAAGVTSTSHHDDHSPMDTTVTHTVGTHGMDIKYSDLVTRSSVADMSRISVLQTHGGYAYEDDRLSIPHMQEASEVSEQQAADTKPIILPQTGDVSIVTYPQVGESVGAMAVPQTGNISMVILPQTGDIGQMSVDSGEVRRIDFLPADDSNTTEIQTADGSRMNIHQDGNIIRISLPGPGEIGRYHLPHTDTSQLQIQQMDTSRTILPQTSEIRSVEVEDKADVGRMLALQNRDIELQHKYDVNRVLPFQSAGVSDMRSPRTSDANAVETQQMYKVRTDRTGDMGADTRQHMYDVSKTAPSLAGGIRSDDRHMYSVDSGIVSQAEDLVAVDRQRIYDAARTALSAGPVEVPDRQQVYSSARTAVPQAVDSSAGENQQVYDVSATRRAQAGDASAAERQHMYAVRSDPSQVTVVGTADGKVSVAHTDEASLMRIHPAGDFKMSSAAYTDPSIMTLPQTSGVRVVNLPGTEDIVDTGSHRPAFDVKRMSVPEQPHPEYGMRVISEAAEMMISAGSVPADDINMRLMAETADFVSRNGPQTTVKTTAGSIQKIQDIHTDIVTGTAEANKMKTPQNNIPAVLSNTSHTVESVRPASEKRTGSASAEVSSANATRNSQPGKSVAAGQKGVGEKWGARSGPRGEKGKQGEQRQVELGFWIQFLNSQSYRRWKDIGRAQGLHNDEEIAGFLMEYYHNTCGVFPSGRSTCTSCQQQLQVSCVACSKKTAGDGREGKKDNKKASNDRTRLWKLIVEASPKDKGEDKGKEDKVENRHRRKPRQTRRVLRRRVIVSPPLSSDDDSQGEPDMDTTTSEPAPPPKVEREEEKKNTPSPMVTRRRGRPSNDSYHRASTLQCPGCQRKFHTTVGLDQHIKRNRCKASKLATPAPSKKEPEKMGEKTNTAFQFQCVDCGKGYRSRQGLMLHRVSKHGEQNESLEMALPEGDDGDDTDEYTPDQKDGTPKVFQCTACQKEYRSKQGLLMHKASKHSGAPERKIKEEKERENAAAESGEDSPPKDGDSFKCMECNKTYNSRPGYMLHMKTKHFPMILRECPECDDKFKTKVELRIHIRREHNKGMLILFCPYCPMIFHNRDNLRNHMDDNHKTCRRVLFDCVACDLQFSSRIERKRHIQSEHKGKDTSLTCHYCGSWFATRHEYDEHEKAGHPEQTQEWLCATCGDAFPTRYLLQRHALSHKEKILCQLCNKYITEPCYDDHMKRHNGTKTWKCELCSKSFIRKAELQQHTLVHKDERPFCCELCGMRYREKSRLNSHMRTHTGVKPYKCHQCDKCFTRSRELKNHMRVHTGEKPFACSVCGRRFASSGNLSAHRRKVHKLDPIPHGQQSRKHTLEESIKPENKTSDPPPPPPAAPSGASMEVGDGGGLEPPVAHSSLTLQAPAAHQAPALVYQQHMIPKYEPLVTQPDAYIPQPVSQQAQASVAIYWPNASYGEES